MRLSKFKAFGFKTFAEPTTLDFDRGITAIVGPNGSGKSNLVDAIRWVLGETSTKSLRSGRLEDVIFAGNDKRKPLGLAEVSILFDNSERRLPIDFAEVEITRRAYRVGESEYFINRSHVRLRDIHDLIMGTGLGPGSYSIVSQGQIDSILTSKPTERRALFEETAGINKFLARKHESLRRLEQTEQNAIRINDLVVELERRIPELDTQVRRAKRYRKVSARVRDLEILSYLRASASRRSERESLRADLERNEVLRSGGAARVATLGAELAELRTRAYQQELQLEELRGRAQRERADLSRIEAEYAAALARREALEAQNTLTSEDAARVEAEREQLEDSVASLGRQLVPLQTELDEARERELAGQSALAATRAQLDTIFTRLREVEADAGEDAARRAERRAHSENLRANAEQLDAQADAARQDAQTAEIAAGAATHKLGERKRELESLEAQALQSRLRREDAERAMARVQEDLARALDAHREYSGEVAAAQSRLHTIEELEAALEGHVPGTRAVVEAWQRGQLRGIAGVVSNLIETDERYARAMDVAFGTRLSNIITQTSEDAERAIDYLNARELGRATFLPLDSLVKREGKQVSPDLRDVAGVIGYAHTLVRTQSQYESVIRFLIGGVLVVDTLRTGIHLVRERGFADTIVTLTGEQISRGGAITGGRFKRERSILSRRVQAQSLREQFTEMHARLSEYEAAAATARDDAEEALALRDGLKEALARLDVGMTEVRADVARIANDEQRLRGEFEFAQARVLQLQAEARQMRDRERAMTGDGDLHATQDQRRELEEKLQRARADIAQAEGKQTESSARAADLRERFAAISAERDAARARLGLLDVNSERARAARERMLAEIGALAEQTRSAHAHVEGLKRGISDVDGLLETARQGREKIANQMLQVESDLRTAENEERETAAGGERHRTRLAEIEAELGMLVSQFAQNPATDDECRDVEVRYEDEPDSVTVDLPRLREELARLQANVNLNADVERSELSQREAFLREQLDDLARARETLLATIREIEQQTQARFNETFEQVAKAFVETYARLSGGGLAKMWQTDPENLSETGIEISAQPPSKKLMPLASLSGGERAMVAAALIFALIEVKPSPFYLLDEVDAALDDANVERFSDMVREYASDSQMIIVTHNKKTMELADRMYGVTMSEGGVSSIVSVELVSPEAEALLA